MILKTKLIRAGSRLTIRALATPGPPGKKDPCETLSFCKFIQKTDPPELSKLTRLWTDMADKGVPKNDTKFKSLSGTGGLYEIKTTRIRILCFWDQGSLIVCTHAFVKTTAKTPKAEIEKASKLRSSYFEAKQAHALSHDHT